MATPIETLRRRRVVPSSRSHAEWMELPAQLREESFWSARNIVEDQLSAYRTFLQDFFTEEKETITREDGTTVEALKAGTRTAFVQDFKERFGGGPDEGLGAVTDPLSTTRLNLIFSTQTRLAWGRGAWDEGNLPELLDAFPAARFVRIGFVQEPRELHEQHIGEVRLKSNIDYWLSLNTPEDGGFKLPYPPFGFNSQCDWEDVPIEEALQQLPPEEAALLKKEGVQNPGRLWEERVNSETTQTDNEK